MGFPIALLVDDFTDSVVAPMWAGSAQTGSGSIAETGGQVRMTLPSSTAGSHSAYFRTSPTYDLTGGSVYININQMVSTAVAAEAYFQLYDLTSANNQAQWYQVSGTLKARTVINSVITDRYSVAWSATTYKYLRIREVGGSIFWDSSTNGTSWTNRASLPAPFDISNFHFQLYATCGNVASPGSFRVDDINLPLPAPSSTWRETVADWQVSNRLRSVTLTGDGGKQAVLVTADTMDAARVLGGTVRYFAGPMGSTSGGYLQLTEYASLALAQASAFPVPIIPRVDLPAMVDARFMRLYHRSIDGLAHSIYEYIPRRLVQADDVEAENISTMHLSAGSVTADKIAVLDLSAITATIGQLTIASAQGLAAWIYQGTGTGDAPSTGLKIFNSGGIGKLSTYNTGVEQVTLDTDGKFKAAAGAILMDVSGITAIGASGYTAGASLKWSNGASIFGEVWGTFAAASTHDISLFSRPLAGEHSTLTLRADAPSGKVGQATLSATAPGLFTTITVRSDNGVTIDRGLLVGTGTPPATGYITATGGLLVGTAGSVGAGQLTVQLQAGIGIAAQGNVMHFVRGADSGTTNYTCYYDNGAAAGSSFYVRNDGLTSVGRAGAGLGFYGSSGAGRGTITGAKGGNVALANLLATLAGLNLIVDSTGP